MADLRQSASDLRELRSDLVRLEALRDSAFQRLDDAEQKIIELDGEVDLLDRVSDLFRLLIDQEVVDNAKTAQDLLTEGLQAVFHDLDLSVRADVDIQRGKVSVDLVTIQKHPDGTTTEGSPTEVYGGSVSTVQSTLLRIVVLTRRGLRPLLLLDETLGAVAEDYVPRVGQFLALLAERLKMDVLAVSHNSTILESANQAYRIKRSGGEATFHRIRRSP